MNNKKTRHVEFARERLLSIIQQDRKRRAAVRERNPDFYPSRTLGQMPGHQPGEQKTQRPLIKRNWLLEVKRFFHCRSNAFSFNLGFSVCCLIALIALAFANHRSQMFATPKQLFSAKVQQLPQLVNRNDKAQALVQPTQTAERRNSNQILNAHILNAEMNSDIAIIRMSDAPISTKLPRPIIVCLIERGDTFCSLSKKYGIELTTIEKMNPSANALRLQIGQKLFMPVAD